MPAAAPADPMPRAIAFADIRYLDELWSAWTFRTMPPPRRDQRYRILLDLLGLGLEQAMTYLGRQRPSFAEFEAWAHATAGAPDGVAVARYHAWLDGVAPPAETQAWLAAIDAAAPILDADDLAHWDQEGWVILRHAISPEEARAAAALVWRLLDASPDDPATWYALGINGIMIQHFQDPAMEAARRSPRVHKAFAQLWGTGDLWPTVDRLGFNPPETSAQPFPGPNLHWDASLSTPIPFATQGILYLTDTAADQGALRVVPGFHHRIEAWLDGLGERDPRREDLSAQAVPIAAGAGDLVIWRQDLPHGASANRADRPRLVQYVNLYAPDLTDHPVWR